MKFSRSIRWAGCAFATLLLAGPLASGQSNPPVPTGFMRLSPEEVPVGTIVGDPSKPGLYVTRNRFAAGMGSRPHYHDKDRWVTVIKGTWWVSLGPEADVYNPDKMIPIKPGGFVFHPAFGHHYDGAKDEEVIVQIVGIGPVTTTQLEPGRGSNSAGAGNAGRGGAQSGNGAAGGPRP